MTADVVLADRHVVVGSPVLRAPRLRPSGGSDRCGVPNLTGHAQMRMREFGVSSEMVIDAFRRPQQTWPAKGGCIEHVGEAITLVIDTARNIVVTVKLRTTCWYVHGIHHLGNLPTG